jgi:penicillin-binding protein 2
LGEEEGLIPSSFWKQETFADRWYLGDTYNLSIGQGYVLVTPLQLNLATAVFANGGYLCKPKLLKDEIPECKSLGLSKKTLDLIGQGMKQACSPGGTGWPLFKFKVQSSKFKVENQEKVEEQEIQTACKTGTAESHDKTKLPYAWFTVFAPFEKPEIVLTVLIEEAGQGSDIAGPIAREILKSYFERKE